MTVEEKIGLLIDKTVKLQYEYCSKCQEGDCDYCRIELGKDGMDNDLIYMQAAIDATIDAADDWDGSCNKKRERFIREALEKQKEPCSICKSLENGDTLYSMSGWDGGIGFDYIRNIEYCPVCGRKL